MQEDFHYYATYCAAYLAGYSHEDSQLVAYAAQYVDCCTKTLLKKIKGPVLAATTQSQMELMDTITDIIGLQNITRIWSSFHFLPYDLYAHIPKRPKVYMDKYRLICKPNGMLVKKTVKLAKDKNLASVGVAMHVLADTWAHSYFAGTPSQVINNTYNHFYELRDDLEPGKEVKIHFTHKPSVPDDIDKGNYSNSVHQENENSIMNLGHGRAGHFPDYSFARYKYLPAWGDYEEILKDNPSDYYKAFCQMVYAMKYLRGEYEDFELNTYDIDSVISHEITIKSILNRRQANASKEWKEFGEKISGKHIEPFNVRRHQDEYVEASKARKGYTFLGQFMQAAIDQKSMVTGEIFMSGNLIAGFSVRNRFEWNKLIEYLKNISEKVVRKHP